MRLIPGFHFKETMRGSYYLLDRPTDERSFEIRLVVRAAHIGRFLRDKTWRIEGEADVDGLATARPLHGTLAFRLLDEKRLPYRFEFKGDDGKTYEFRGQKDFTPIAPLTSMTVLPASLYDERGEEIGRATLRFDLRNDLGRFLKSFRIARAAHA